MCSREEMVKALVAEANYVEAQWSSPAVIKLSGTREAERDKKKFRVVNPKSTTRNKKKGKSFQVAHQVVPATGQLRRIKSNKRESECYLRANVSLN